MPPLEVDYGQRYNMRVEFTTLSYPPVGCQDFFIGRRIQPRCDSQPMHVLHCGTSRREHSFLARLWYHRPYLVNTRVYQETVRLEIWPVAVISSTDRVEAADQLLVDPCPLLQRLVHPRRMAVHPFEQDRLICVGSSVKALIQFLVLRPECQRNSTHRQNVSLHSSSALLGLGRERHQFINGADVLSDIGRDQRQAALHRVTMAVNQPRHQEIAL